MKAISNLIIKLSILFRIISGVLPRKQCYITLSKNKVYKKNLHCFQILALKFFDVRLEMHDYIKTEEKK